MKDYLGNYFVLDDEILTTNYFDTSYQDMSHYIYEVFRVIDGVPLFLEDHLNRLHETCKLTGNCHEFSTDRLQHLIHQLISRNGLSIGNIKIVGFPKNNKIVFQIYITPHQYPTKEQYEKGVDVVLYSGIRDNPNAKVMDVAMRADTQRIKDNQNIYETLLTDREGYITEGSRSNVFFVRNDKVITPPVKDVLPGVTRKNIMLAAKKSGISIIEEKVPANSVVVMEAVFISGTSRKVLPVKQVGEVEFDVPHPIVTKVSNAFNERVSKYIERHKNF